MLAYSSSASGQPADIARLQRVQAALDGAALLVTETDMHGVITYANAAAHRYFGYSSEECIGKTVLELTCPADRERLQQQVREWVQQGLRTAAIENRIVHRNGTLFTFLWSVTIHYDEQGHPTHFTSIGHDISQQERLRQELHEKREMLYTVIDNLPVGVFWKDKESRFLGCNRRVLDDAGLTSFKQIIGKTDFDLPWHKKAPIYQHSDRAIMNTGPKLDIEETLTRGDGSVIWLRTAKLPLRRNGEIIGVLGFYEDITELRHQEEGLRTFRLLVENAPDGIGITDPDLIITYANPAFAAMLGYETLTGKVWLDLVHPDDRPRLEAAMRQPQRAGIARITLRYLHRDGTIIMVQCSVPVLRNRNGRIVGYASINRDITEQLRAEEERQRLALQEQVIQAQQAILRELSTPLLPIATGVVAMPLIGTIDSTRAQQVMETLLEGINRYRATVAIIDITGVKVVDTQVAGALIRAAQAAGLLGAQVVLTGISPEIAQTLVHIGVEFYDLVAKTTLQEGIDFALSRRYAPQYVNGRRMQLKW
ncbi:PAS domain S-box protein [uncultured Chloroflexus sp.]|uniref:PAS domain S-box protein n=1 Tax=uncultured Chloroflexus sp. TaxID=214040 RepID=UPI00261C88F9|nr:PAS domain S-box protein [uncultured Chloroflexus sp.]